MTPEQSDVFRKMVACEAELSALVTFLEALSPPTTRDLTDYMSYGAPESYARTDVNTARGILRKARERLVEQWAAAERAAKGSI